MDTKLLSMFMHDLKQPVDALRACLDYAISTAESEDMVRLLSLGRENANYIKRIVNNICDIAKYENKTVEINCFSMDVKEYADVYVEKLAPYFEEKNVKLAVELTGDMGIFVCDFDIVSKILNDIVSNAIKYNDKEEKEVKLSFDAKDDSLTIAVADNGMGIPEDEVVRVTELMYRASNAKKNIVNGSGLGLNLVNGLVESLKGSMTIKSKLNIGTTVTITVPAGKVTSLASGEAVIKSLKKETLDLLFSDIVTKY